LGFTPDFINYVNKGIKYAIKEQYPLNLQTIPFTVNEDAQEEPYQTMLSLQCAEGSTVLENFNNYETTDFIYQPASCGEVTLKVVFPTFTAVKTWGGRFGFPKLLQSFRDGVNVIVREDFDIESQAALQRKNIKWVRVRYIIDPKVSSEITGILDNIPGKVPQIISSTW
jgi:type VI secretion system protein ImpL